MEPHPNLTYILLWELLPEALAIAAGAIYLSAAKGMALKGFPIDSFRVRTLSFMGLLSCILSAAGTFAEVMSSYLILAEPFELLAVVLFGILIFRPALILRSKLRIYLAAAVALSGLNAMLFMWNTLRWLTHGVR
ncbi:MAG: hypothetical protein WAM04_02365 [Candidatus Sulfotelmatobacter sp.]